MVLPRSQRQRCQRARAPLFSIVCHRANDFPSFVLNSWTQICTQQSLSQARRRRVHDKMRKRTCFARTQRNFCALYSEVVVLCRATQATLRSSGVVIVFVFRHARFDASMQFTIDLKIYYIIQKWRNLKSDITLFMYSTLKERRVRMKSERARALADRQRHEEEAPK